MYTLQNVKDKLLEAIPKILDFDHDQCNHDDYIFCPMALVRLFSVISIRGLDIIDRIDSFKTELDGHNCSMEDYWKEFIDHLIVEPDDVSVYQVEKYI